MKNQKVFNLGLPLVLSVLVVGPAHGELTSLNFSTGGQNDFSWTVTATNGTAVVFF